MGWNHQLVKNVFPLTIFAADFNHFTPPSQETSSGQMRAAVGEDMKVFGGFADLTKHRIQMGKIGEMT